MAAPADDEDAGPMEAILSTFVLVLAVVVLRAPMFRAVRLHMRHLSTVVFQVKQQKKEIKRKRGKKRQQQTSKRT